MKSLPLSIEILFAFLCVVKIKGEPDWTYEILEIDCNNQTPDKFDINIYLKRIARGYFVVDGIVNIGEDITDRTIISANVFYSANGQYYTRTPFQISQMPISKFFNTYYKDFILDGLKDCGTNLPFIDRSETFIPPLTKRVTRLENCTFPNDNMPSHMRSGYYNITFVLKNQVDTSCYLLANIEPK